MKTLGFLGALLPAALSSVFGQTTPDIAMSSTYSPSPYLYVGMNATNLVYAANNGSGTANDVVFTDPIPQELIFISATTTRGSCTNSGGVLVCDVGQMSFGQTVFITVVFAAPSVPSTFTNISFFTTSSPETNTHNNFATNVLTAVWPPPKIDVPPASQAVPPGATATLTVQASGVAPLSYQWQFYYTNLPGATNASLLVSNVGPAQLGTYSVIVSNAGGTVSSYAALSLMQIQTYVGLSLLSANTNYTYRIEYTTNLTNPVIWTPLTNYISTTTNSNPTEFIDRDSPKTPKRFYRVIVITSTYITFLNPRAAPQLMSSRTASPPPAPSANPVCPCRAVENFPREKNNRPEVSINSASHFA